MERMRPSGQHLVILHLLRTPSLSFFIYKWDYLPHKPYGAREAYRQPLPVLLTNARHRTVNLSQMD